MAWSTIEVCRYRKRQIGHVALYVPWLCVIFSVDRRLHRYELTHIRSHAASYSSWLRFHLPFWNVRPQSHYQWLLLQGRGGLSGVCVDAVSRRVMHCLKRLLFGSIRLQLHLGEVLQEPWLAVVEMWGRWSWNEVGSAEFYIVSYKSKWNEWQPTCTFNSSWMLLHIGQLRIAAADSNGHAISVSRSNVVCLFTGIHPDERQLIYHVW